MGVFDGQQVFSITIPATPKNGFIALGTDNFGLANFDNFKLVSAHLPIAVDNVDDVNTRYSSDVFKKHTIL
jgi:hypothetical protein